MKTAQKSTDNRVTRFGKLIDKADKDLAAKQVHKLRTSARRIEALAQFSAGKFSGKESKTLAEIRAIRRKAGKVRDVDVQMELLKTIGNGSKHPHHQELADHLNKKRSRREKKLFNEIESLQKSKWRHRLDSLQEAIASQPAASQGNSAFQTAKRQLASLAAKHNDFQHLHDAEQLHQLRITLKKIRYTAELGAQTGEAKQFASAVEQAQDAIGTWHDWLMLTKTAEKAIGKYPSSAFFLQLRSLTTEAFGKAIKVTHDTLHGAAPGTKKSPQSTGAGNRSLRSA